jgi:hypothetical protein
MMIEDKLSGLMHERADRPVDADALLAGALAAGRTRKRRRQAAYAVASAGVAGAVAATLLVNTGGGGPRPVPGTVTGDSASSWDTVPVLPAVAGEPGAAARPDLVGTDPTVLRFSAPWAPFPVQSVSWSVHEGIEEINISMLSGSTSGQVMITGTVTVWRGAGGGELDNSSVPNEDSSIVVDGHPAVLSQEQFDWGRNRWIVWHPAENLTVQVGLVASGFLMSEDRTDSGASVVGVEDLKAFAEAVRLDTTTACSVPFRLSVMPTGARLLNCSGSVMADERGEGIRNGFLLLSTGTRLTQVDYRTPMDDPAESQLYPTGSPDPLPAPDTADPTSPISPTSPGAPNSPIPLTGPTVDPPIPTGVTATDPSGRMLSRDETRVRAVRPKLGAWVLYQPGGAAEASAVAAGLVPVGDPDDPATWPRRPLG